MYLEMDHETASGGAIGPSRFSLRGRVLRSALRAIDTGRLTIILPSGESIEHSGKFPGNTATIALHDHRVFRRILAGGDLGFADGFIAGEWTTPDLVALIGLFADNAARLQRTMDGLVAVRLFNRLKHVLRGNSRAGAKRNIAFHYDLGNDFYRLWLDDSMTYSSACAVAAGQTLELAQAARLERIAGLLDLQGGEQVLEIGIGWGALAAHLAPRCAGVTGLTLSREQLTFAEQRCRNARLTNVDLRLQDYRDVDETFERIVSIEMLEAVGEEWWPTYFGKLRSCLAPGGTAVLQVITMREDRFASYRTNTDFIQQYIFPGGMLPTPAIIVQQAELAGLKLQTVDRFGQGYAATLAEWRRRFLAAEAEVAALGFDAEFRRLWEYYLCYCEAGFRSGTIDVGLYVLKG
jgi:cyclopropane-fatty-acyl-phospholipid synthase